MTLRPFPVPAFALIAALAFRAGAANDAAPYLVLDLSEGSRDDACYPVRFLDAPPAGGWGEEYRTRLVALRRIEPGSVRMGCGPWELGYAGNERPAAEVRISRPYYIGVFELTQAQWRRVAGSPCGLYAGDDHPVESVSWERIRGRRAGASWPASARVDEGSFLGCLRDRTCIGSWDLPTEAQWEYACRAGATNAIAPGLDLVSTGRDPGLDRFARYSAGVSGGPNGVRRHEAVGSFEPNAWGLYDMHGNVAEWCRDWYAGRSRFPAGDEPEVDPAGPASGRERAVRGGSWFDLARLCRSASRARMAPAESNPRTGFRLVCEPPTEEELAAAAEMATDLAARREAEAAERSKERAAAGGRK